MQVKSISQLVQLALSDKENLHSEFSFSKLPAAQARIIEPFIHRNLTGVERVLDTSAIRHTMRQHGNSGQEIKRGQIAVTTDDFGKIPLVLKEPDKITYKGKNPFNQDVFLYSKKIGCVYIVAEAVRFSKKGDKLVFSTLYKKK